MKFCKSYARIIWIFCACFHRFALLQFRLFEKCIADRYNKVKSRLEAIPRYHKELFIRFFPRIYLLKVWKGTDTTYEVGVILSKDITYHYVCLYIKEKHSNELKGNTESETNFILAESRCMSRYNVLLSCWRAETHIWYHNCTSYVSYVSGWF